MYDDFAVDPKRPGRQQVVQKRLTAVRAQLAAHDSNLALLQAFQEGYVHLTGKGYSRAVEHYQPTPEDRARLPRTVANLQAQRAVLLKELALLEYGL